MEVLFYMQLVISMISLLNQLQQSSGQGLVVPAVTTQVLSPTSIRVTFTQPSGSPAAESYDLQYTRVIGAGQTLCGIAQDTGATTDVQSPFTITNLEEFSSYDITVTAYASSAMQTTTEQVITSPAAPSAPPQSVMVSSVTSSCITVQWGRVSCIDRNSEITGYTVRYSHQLYSATTVMESVPGTSDSDRMFTASGLIPHTSYTFEVAAVSSEGTGPFSTGTTVETTVPEAVALQLSGQRYGNNSLVALTAIGEGDTAALLCLTDREQCCRYQQLGGWYFPHGGPMPDGLEGAAIYRNRGPSRVRLNRRNNAQSPTGVYRCEVPDANGTNQSIYVGVYVEGGAPTISSIQFHLTSAANAATLSFNLSCITAGGPVNFNDITWTRAGSSLPANHGLFQVLDDGSTATYTNTLAVTGRETGQYSCQLQHSGSTTFVDITVEAANPPSGLTAVQSDLTSVLVSWIAPASGGASRTGYRIFYQTGGYSQSVYVGAGATSHTITGLLIGIIYNISIVALSNTLPSAVLAPVTVEAPTVMTSVLGPTSIRVTFTQTNGIPPEKYIVQATRIMGMGQDVCPETNSPEDTVTVSSVASPYDITSLQEFSTYDITVTAMFLSSAMMHEVYATTVRNTTSAAASAPPRGVEVVNATDTAITVHWEPLHCIEINSQFQITGYAVRYGFASEPDTSSEISSALSIVTINILTPGVEYFIEVAAVNSNGETGEFSDHIMQTTSGDLQSSCVWSPETTIAAAVVVVLILALTGVVIAVLVLKHRRGAPPLTQQPHEPPMEGVVLTTFSDSTKPAAAISTGPNAAYHTVASVGRQQGEGEDGEHTYDYIVPPVQQSHDQQETPNVYERM